jgi:hypothetical protein
VCMYVCTYVCMYVRISEGWLASVHLRITFQDYTVTLCAAAVRYVQPIIIYEAILCSSASLCYQHYTQLHFNARTLANTPFNVHQVD